MSHLGYLKHGRRILFKRGASLLYFVFFVTEYCNARCGTCLLGTHDPVHRTKELTIDEIEKVSASMDDMLFFTPTGGEPFLRKDLAEIVRIFHLNNHAVNVGIPTNGSLTSRVVQTTRDILDKCPDVDLHIDVSIDAIGEEHDRVRGRPGLFGRAVETYRELRDLERHYRNLSTCVEVTVGSQNQDKLLETYDYLKELGVNTVFTLLVRGAPKEPGYEGIDISRFEEFSRVLEEDQMARTLTGYYKMPFGDFINAKRLVRARMIVTMVREQRYLSPCYAGSLGGCMFSDGRVLPCEMLVDMPIGNVRDFGYDFKKIWFSKEGDAARKAIRDGRCFCTYECFLTINILFNPQLLPGVLKEWGRLKLAKLQYAMGGGRARGVDLPQPLA